MLVLPQYLTETSVVRKDFFLIIREGWGQGRQLSVWWQDDTTKVVHKGESQIKTRDEGPTSIGWHHQLTLHNL